MPPKATNGRCHENHGGHSVRRSGYHSGDHQRDRRDGRNAHGAGEGRARDRGHLSGHHRDNRRSRSRSRRKWSRLGPLGYGCSRSDRDLKACGLERCLSARLSNEPNGCGEPRHHTHAVRGRNSHRGHEFRADYRCHSWIARKRRPNQEHGSSHSDSKESQATSEYSGTDSGESSVEEKKAGSGKEDIVHFAWHKGLVLGQKYSLVRLLGDGTFGRVVLACDRVKNTQVAIKIIRDVKRYMDNAKIEADILNDIRKIDPHGHSRCAIMYETFTHDNRFFCLVFEALGASLYDFLKRNNFRGFWVQDIQIFVSQCLKGLKFLHTQLQMTHTDLKPENILFQSMDLPLPSRFPREAEWQEAHKSKSRNSAYFRPINNQIKLIDFGNATYEDEHHSSIINTRQYRGPEVVLELGWNERSDIWSLGCIFLELYTGELLFGTHDNLEHLALMERIIGPLPSALLAPAGQTVKEKYLTQDSVDNWRLNWPCPSVSSSSERHVRSQRPLANLVLKQHAMLAACASSMLTQKSSRRPSAAEVLKHPFFLAQFDD